MNAQEFSGKNGVAEVKGQHTFVSQKFPSPGEIWGDAQLKAKQIKDTTFVRDRFGRTIGIIRDIT